MELVFQFQFMKMGQLRFGFALSHGVAADLSIGYSVRFILCACYDDTWQVRNIIAAVTPHWALVGGTTFMRCHWDYEHYFSNTV